MIIPLTYVRFQPTVVATTGVINSPSQPTSNPQNLNHAFVSLSAPTTPLAIGNVPSPQVSTLLSQGALSNFVPVATPAYGKPLAQPVNDASELWIPNDFDPTWFDLDPSTFYGGGSDSCGFVPGLPSIVYDSDLNGGAPGTQASMTPNLTGFSLLSDGYVT